MPKTEKTNAFDSQTCEEVEKKVLRAAKIFDEYGEKIRDAIYLQVNNKSEAEDIYQDFFLSLVHRPIPAHIQNVKGYIYRAVKNDVLDAANRDKSYQGQIAKYAEHQSVASWNVVRKNNQNILIWSEEIQKVIQIIKKQLPRREAQAVLLRYSQNLNIGEAAKSMQINKRSFSRYLCMGLKKIREIIQKEKTLVNNLL